MGDLVAFLLLWLLGWWLLWRVPPPPAARGDRGPVSVVVPARDEAHNLPALLGSLVPQLGPGDELLVVDDGSTDGTAAVAAAGGATVVAAPPLPDGWLGKPWACRTGAARAANDRLLFLDADTRVAPGGLDRLVPRGPGLFSVQPFHVVPTAAEKLAAFCNLVGMMGTGAFSPLGRARGAFGPCLATSVADYGRAGGHDAVRASVLDDVDLARAYRRAGLPVDVRGGRGVLSFRMYPTGLRALVDGFTKNLAGGAGSSGMVGTLLVAGWLAACVAPAVLATRVAPPVAVACYAAVALQVWAHVRRIGTFGPVVAALYPLPLLLFLAVFARSLLLLVRRGRVRWKGRAVRVG